MTLGGGVAIFARAVRRPLLLLVLAVALAAPPAFADNSDADRAWRQALALIEQGLQGAAMEPMREARDLAPDNLWIHCDYQDLLKAQGYVVDVIEEYRVMRDASPSSANAHYLYGRATGDPAIAREEFGRALELDPGHVWAEQGLGGVSAVEGKLDEAVRHYEAALAMDPSRADVHNKLAGIHYATGNTDAAMAAWQAAIERSPDDYHAYLNMGAVLSMQGDLEGARELLAMAVQRAPGNPLAYVNHGYVLFKLQRYDEAIANFHAALAINPRDRTVAGSLEFVEQVKAGTIPFEAFAPYEKGLAASAADPAQAIQHFKEVILLAPGFAVAHMNVGLMQVTTGQVEEGLEALRKSVELAPDDVASRYNLGFVLLSLQQLGEAKPHLERARQIDPGDVDVLSALALAQLGLGELDASVATYVRALELQPRDPVLWVQKASAEAAQGDLSAAATSAREALEIAPAFVTARIQLVAILRQARRFDEALTELKPLEEMAPDHPDILAERAALESGRDALAASAAEGRVRLSRILVTDAAQAEAVRSKLGSGGDFGELARRYGVGSEKGRSGDIGFVDPDDLRDDLAGAVRGLGVGERTDVIDLGGSWVVLLRTE